MEPSQKKVKITHHFRVALKPQNINHPSNNIKKAVKKLLEPGKENHHNHQIQVITISDDEEDENDLKKTTSASSQVPLPLPLPLQSSPCNKYIHPPGIGPNVVDHDGEMVSDIYCEPHYAWDSFAYDREQELKFRTTKYMGGENQDITPHLRARLIDWLVTIQNDFSLFHETLYMAVKIADQYLMRKTVTRKNLQLLYMTSVWISAKFDERLPPVEISELLQHSGVKYTREQVISIEVDILITLDFNIRFPLSYGFLRRYARCTRSSLRTLTLARYILESSLLEYEMIEIFESKIAAAALLLAFKMLDMAWTETAEFYTGYKQEELYPLITHLNAIISRPKNEKISAIRNKYTDKTFMSVARISSLSNIEPLA